MHRPPPGTSNNSPATVDVHIICPSSLSVCVLFILPLLRHSLVSFRTIFSLLNSMYVVNICTCIFIYRLLFYRKRVGHKSNPIANGLDLLSLNGRTDFHQTSLFPLFFPSAEPISCERDNNR